MKKIFYLLFVFPLLYSCGGDKDLEKEKKTTKKTNPGSQSESIEYDIRFTDVSIQSDEQVKLFLSINQRNYQIDEISGLGVDTIPRNEYSDFDIPESAISAIQGYWAGSQTIFYIKDLDSEVSIRKAEVYEGEVDELINYKEIFRVGKDDSGDSNDKQVSSSSNDDFYILNVSAVKEEKKAINEVQKLKAKGFNADYLWIPDFNSLSKAEYFSVYIGPYETQKECEIAVSDYRKTNPKAYGLLVSQENKRVQINGINNIKVTEPYH